MAQLRDWAGIFHGKWNHDQMSCGLGAMGSHAISPSDARGMPGLLGIRYCDREIQGVLALQESKNGEIYPCC